MKDPTTGFVTTAMTFKKILIQGYFRLTGSLPRRLPETKEELERMRETLIQYFGVDEAPETWYTVYSEITGTCRTNMRRSLKELANVARRLHVNQIVQDHKVLASEAIRAKLEEKLKEVVSEEGSDVREGASDIQGKLQTLREAPERMV